MGIPFNNLRANLAQNPFADLADQAGFLGNGNELHRRNKSASGPVPAQQCFHPGQTPGRKMNFGLIIDFELFTFYGIAQIVFHRKPGNSTFIHHFGEEVIGAAAARLGAIHGGIGIAHQGGKVVAIGRA